MLRLQLPRSMAFVPLALLGSFVLGDPTPGQSRPRIERDARIEHAPTSVTVVFDGFVLGPDGGPAAGAVVVSSAGGKAVTELDGRYRLEVEVPLAAESVQLTAVANDSGALASASVDLLAITGSVPVDPLVLALGSSCELRWLPTFGGQPGLGGIPNAETFLPPIAQALAVFDDGSGPALYAGGSFFTAGGVVAEGMAKWDGSRWSAIGSGLLSVNALAAFDDGDGPVLYAGGSFSFAGAMTVNRIARWDGSSWAALGSGMSGGDVAALAVFDDGSGPALYAGGDFTTAGGTAASRIAKWNGTSWAALGSGVNKAVLALTVLDDGSGPALYAGGEFTTAGGAAANRIAKWDGTSWSALGSGMSVFGSAVQALAGFDDGSGPALYAGGNFTNAGGVAANHIAKWDGTSWSALGSGMNGPVNALRVFDGGSGPELYSGSSGAPHYIARWNGSSWSPVHGGMNNQVLAFTEFDDGSGPALFAGGRFTTAGGLGALRVAKWDGANWSRLGHGMNASPGALTVFDDGSGPALFAGGAFTTVGGVATSRIAKWDGSSWASLGSGLNGSVGDLAVFDDGSGPALYAGGYFTTAGGVAADHIAKWNGASWSALGSGSNGEVLALAVFDDGGGPALYAGGDFETAGGVAANNIAKWDGASWSALGNGVSDVFGILDLTVFDDGGGPALYAAATDSIDRWDGSSWTSLGGVVAEYPEFPAVHALTVFDDGSGPALFAGGEFGSVGGVPANRIAKWDGASWSALGSGADWTVFALQVFNDGSGPALHAGGRFDSAGGVASRGIAKWGGPPSIGGTGWSAVPGGVGFNGSVSALTAFRHALLVGGDFASASDTEDSFLARWGRPAPCFVPSKVRRR